MKEFLSQKGVNYSEKNVASDAVARDEMFRQTGRMAVPTVRVDEQVVVGFDKKHLEELLA